MHIYRSMFIYIYLYINTYPSSLRTSSSVSSQSPSKALDWIRYLPLFLEASTVASSPQWYWIDSPGAPRKTRKRKTISSG